MNTNYTLKSRDKRRAFNLGFRIACICAATIALFVLGALLFSILKQGLPRLLGDGLSGLGQFLGGSPKMSEPDKSGIGPALAGSVSILAICALSAIPLGVASAILLEEYKPGNRTLKSLHGFIQSNITNLAGVPSIVYGILGYSVFVLMFGWLGTLTSPGFDMGQDFFLEYPGAGKEVFYVKSREDARLTPAALDSDQVFYASLSDANADKPIQIKIVPEGELNVIREDAKTRTDAANAAMKRALRRVMVDRKAQIDQATAEDIADQMLSPIADTMKADYETAKAKVIDKLLAMDGMTSVEMIPARIEVWNALIDAEMEAAGLTGLIIEGTEPLMKSVEHWYYFQLPFGKSVLAGGLTLMLVILPVIIVASQEAIRAVSQEMRSGVLALGGTKWQAIEKVVMPAAIPGICTGTILALSRAIGEAAPILLIGYVGQQAAPDHLMDGFAALPLEIYNWTKEANPEFKLVAAAGIIVLLIVLFSFNAVAVFIRQKFQKDLN